MSRFGGKIAVFWFCLRGEGKHAREFARWLVPDSFKDVTRAIFTGECCTGAGGSEYWMRVIIRRKRTVIAMRRGMGCSLPSLRNSLFAVLSTLKALAFAVI